MIRIIVTPDREGDKPKQFTIELPEAGCTYKGTWVEAELSGPSGDAAMMAPTGHVAFMMTGKDVIVE